MEITTEVVTDSEYPFTATFVADPYIVETYGIDRTPVVKRMKRDFDFPFAGLEFCATFADGEHKSYFKADKDIPWEDSMACKMMNDPTVLKGGRQVIISGRSATLYSLVCKNENAIMFRPTVHQPVSDAMNVNITYTLEFRFALGDGFILSTLHTVKTTGRGPVALYDAMRDVMEFEYDPDALCDLLTSSPNVFIARDKPRNDDSIQIDASSEETGVITTLDYDISVNTCREFARALCCIRIIDMQEEIV